ncbi:MAG: hypothetical protein AB7K36_08915 [Chloroflexota bacterium]
MRALATIVRFVKRTPLPPADVLEAYAHEVVPVLDRAEWLYQYWLEQSTLFSDSEKLGNVAAVHRWETATMGRSLEKVKPPAVLAGAHEHVLDALDMASRAAQLLTSGSRFHNANAVCEGQALLGLSRERRLSAHQMMRRYLSEVLDAAAPDGLVPDAAPEAMLSRPPGLPGAAALATQADGDAPGVAGSEQPAAADPATDVLAHLHRPDPDGADQAAHEPHDADAHGPDDDFEDDEQEDALPWLTRLEAASSETSAPQQAPADAAPPEPVQPPPTDEAPTRSGWGSLFGRSGGSPDR